MMLNGVSVIGYVHTAASLLALLAGAAVLIRAKSTRLHRRMGRLYFYTMLVANLSVFAIYHFDVAFAPVRAGAGIFGLFHWEAVFTLGFLLLGFVAATRQRTRPWAYAHPVSMVVTYYMLVGALVNELFVRVRPLRDFARLQLHGPASVAQAPIVGQLQRWTMLAFLAILVWFVVKVARERRRVSSRV